MRIFPFLFSIFISAIGYSQSSVTATATVTILKPLSITKEMDMNFAEVTVGETSGTLVLSPNGTRTVSGGAEFPTQESRTGQAATFKISGQDASYSISLPEEILLSDGSRTLIVDSFTHNSTGTLKDGAETVNVGATIHINGKQEPGTYHNANDLRVTVQYK